MTSLERHAHREHSRAVNVGQTTGERDVAEVAGFHNGPAVSLDLSRAMDKNTASVIDAGGGASAALTGRKS